MTNEITNVHRDSRINKLNSLKELDYNPYPYCFKPNAFAKDLLEKYEHLENGDSTEDRYTIAGRAMAVRNDGMFIDLKDETGRIQVFCHKSHLSEEDLKILKCLDFGDIVGVSGFMRRTPRGEISLAAEKFDIISKALLPLPEKFHGLTDVEARYRQRYVDFIMNDDNKEMFRKRSKVVSAVRRFLDDSNFLEVETPILHPILGGANAKPFETHHNALDMSLYLRVAPELYLKKLVIGGFDKVFEIGRNFRNEDIDRSHNPEFTALEVYQAYADYNDMANLAGEIIGYVTERVLGERSFEYQGHIIDVSKPFARKSIIDLVKEHTGIDLLEANDLDTAKAMAKSVGVNADDCISWGKVVQEVFDEKVEDHLIQPILVMDMPRDISPLAKTHRENPRLVEHFDIYIGGMEIGCAYSELSNPLEQKERFQGQCDAREKGDEEAQMMDKDFLNALEIGFAPSGGMGMGMDRLAILLTNADSIRDVIAFPTLRQK